MSQTDKIPTLPPGSSFATKKALALLNILVAKDAQGEELQRVKKGLEDQLRIRNRDVIEEVRLRKALEDQLREAEDKNKDLLEQITGLLEKISQLREEARESEEEREEAAGLPKWAADIEDRNQILSMVGRMEMDNQALLSELAKEKAIRERGEALLSSLQQYHNPTI